MPVAPCINDPTHAHLSAKTYIPAFSILKNRRFILTVNCRTTVVW